MERFENPNLLYYVLFVDRVPSTVYVVLGILSHPHVSTRIRQSTGEGIDKMEKENHCLEIKPQVCNV